MVEEVLGKAFPGTLVSDGLSTYDAVRAARRQLCLAHLIRRASELEKRQTRGAVRVPRQVAGLLRKALDLSRRRQAMGPHGFAVARGRIEAALDRLLRYHLVNAENERLAAHLFRHREHLFTFLDAETVEPTNNLAERQLRPAGKSAEVVGGQPHRAWGVYPRGSGLACRHVPPAGEAFHGPRGFRPLCSRASASPRPTPNPRRLTRSARTLNGYDMAESP